MFSKPASPSPPRVLVDGIRVLDRGGERGSRAPLDAHLPCGCRLPDHARVDGHLECSPVVVLAVVMGVPLAVTPASVFNFGGRNAQMGMLDGKVAIVTGAGNGVGRGEAVMLADHGAKVVVNDLGGSVTGEGSDQRVADEVVEVIKSRGGEAVANYDSVADFEGAANDRRDRGRRVRATRRAREQRRRPAGQDDVLDVARGLRRRRQGAHVRGLQHDAPRLGVLAQRVEGRPPAERVDREHGLERRPAGPGEPDQLRRGQGRHRGDDDHRQPRARPLRRAGELHRPRWLHPHGRPG